MGAFGTIVASVAITGVAASSRPATRHGPVLGFIGSGASGRINAGELRRSCDRHAAVAHSPIPNSESLWRTGRTLGREVVPMMAKKRRRRKVESEDKQPQQPAVVGGDADDVGGGGEEDESAYVSTQGGVDPGLGSVLIPPLPEELGESTWRTAQDLQEEQDMSGASFQPRIEVLDSEMVGDVEGQGLLDTQGKPRKKQYNFDLDIKLPVESEGKDDSDKMDAERVLPMSPDGVMPLPDLQELGKRKRKDKWEKEAVAKAAEPVKRIERGNVADFTRLLELDPEADSEETLFTPESYDALSSILGEGKPFVGIANSYLQSGHTVLLALVLLCAFVELPGFPLTQLPYDIREFLKMGLLVTYVINAGIAYLSAGKARQLNQPVPFWVVKCFVLGGLSYNELSQIELRPVKSKRKKNREI